MTTKTQWITDELASLKQQGLYNTIRTIGSPQGAWLVVDGKRVLNFCSNNYLGLANHPRIVSAAKAAAEKYGVGPAAVRSIAGTMELHVELERRLAAFKGAEACITFQSGFAANLATVPALVGKEDVIFSDELNHASIIDGCRLSGGKIVRYQHNDANDLRRVIAEEKKIGFRRAMIISDGVFSMDGDVAPLADLVKVAEEEDYLLMVDDAHGEGVLGKGGRGIVDHFGLHHRVDIEIGTLSKAFGVVGGCVAGDKTLVEWLRQRGRPFLFSSAMTAPDVAACLAAVDLLEESTALVDRLWDNARYFKGEMKRLG
ncbi:MAG: aminotransferase class I/II-fold pyridoxal phosphate-dependent enzyme, partial [Chloroflexota bacterium]